MLVDGDGQKELYKTRTHIVPSTRDRERIKSARGERGREEARAGSDGGAKARDGQWGGLVVVAPSWREAGKAANVVTIVSVSMVVCVSLTV